MLAIAPIDPACDADVALVAERMHLTLLEVVGRPLYDLPWLVARVRWHLDPSQVEGQVFGARLDGRLVGHTIVRVEDGGGLFSTTYVDPPARRLGVAAALLARGEAWMRERRLPLARTYTDRRNAKLIALYQGRGYGLAAGPDDFVILSKEL